MKPTAVTHSATYLVDVRQLQNVDDVKKDEFGIWNYSGSHPQSYKVFDEEDDDIMIEKCAEGATGTNVVLLRRLRCTHPSNVEFKRLICFLTSMKYMLCIGHISFFVTCKLSHEHIYIFTCMHMWHVVFTLTINVLFLCL